MKRPEKCPAELWERLRTVLWEIEAINHELADLAHEDESPWFSQAIEDWLLISGSALKDVESGWTEADL